MVTSIDYIHSNTGIRKYDTCSYYTYVHIYLYAYNYLAYLLLVTAVNDRVFESGTLDYFVYCTRLPTINSSLIPALLTCFG